MHVIYGIYQRKARLAAVGKDEGTTFPDHALTLILNRTISLIEA